MRAKEFITEVWYNPMTWFGGDFKVEMPKGTRGDDVKKIQLALQSLGYSVGPPGIDGIIGPYTRGAITKYQLDKGIAKEGDNTSTITPAMISTLNNDIKSKGLDKKLSSSMPQKSKNNVANAPKLKPLSQDSVTQGKIGQVLNFIAQYESNGSYNIILGGGQQPLTKMTINQVYELQDKMKRSGKESTAVGRYQFVKATLQECVNGLGLDPNTTLFDEKTQDALIIYRLRSVRGLDNWLSGGIDTKTFLNNLSKEFASMPSPSKGGGSYYAGVGSNKAGTNLQTALSTLNNIQSA